ncbi:MAG: SIMPL domain-containing protein [bacterium]|nr:SIMPL domain-containing protein [bacterium]
MNNENQNWLNDARVRNVAVLLGALLIVFFAVKVVGEAKGLSYIGKGEYPTNTIVVTGKGEVIATPDIANFSFTVSEEGSNVAVAQKKATDKMNAILAYIEDQGVDKKDIKTSSYSIYPRYEWRNATMYVSGTQYLAAYVVSQSVEVKVRDLEKAGTLLSGIGEYGATNVSGLNFTVDAQDELTRDARADAIKDAREQAKVLADSLGVRLGRIVSFNESSPYYPYPMYARDAVYGMGGMEQSAKAPSLPAGENKIISNVTITYEIK